MLQIKWKDVDFVTHGARCGCDTCTVRELLKLDRLNWASQRQTNQKIGPLLVYNDCFRPNREQIAKRAYELWQQRGGAEQDNWVQAERELLFQYKISL